MAVTTYNHNGQVPLWLYVEVYLYYRDVKLLEPSLSLEVNMVEF